MHPSMTPMHHQGTGSATPMHPGLTPGYAPFTPVHHANTPMDDNYQMLPGGPRTAEPDGATPGLPPPMAAPTPGGGGGA
eukprot:215789-Chlamydomonas_euryale.AAC.1